MPHFCSMILITLSFIIFCWSFFSHIVAVHIINNGFYYFFVKTVKIEREKKSWHEVWIGMSLHWLIDSFFLLGNLTEIKVICTESGIWQPISFQCVFDPTAVNLKDAPSFGRFNTTYIYTLTPSPLTSRACQKSLLDWIRLGSLWRRWYHEHRNSGHIGSLGSAGLFGLHHYHRFLFASTDNVRWESVTQGVQVLH